MRRLILCLIIPLAFAWSVTIHTYPFLVDVTAIADSDGCILLGMGQLVNGVVVADGEQTPLEGTYYCVPSGSIVQLLIAGPTIALKLPKGEVSVNSDPFASVSFNESAGILVVEWPGVPGLLMLLGLGGLAILLWQRMKRRNIIDDLSEKERAVLNYIYDHPGCTQKEIGKALSLEKYQVTRILNKLERAGYIWRKRRGISKLVYPRK